MSDLDVKDALHVVTLAIAIAGSHFMTKAKVMVLEERVKGYSKAIEYIRSALERIEHKLDSKQDR